MSLRVIRSAIRGLPNRTLLFQSSHFSRIVENVPALGESITEGTIARWSKSIGDTVEIDDVVVIIETDKVSVEIKSQNRGVLTKQFPKDSVVVGSPLFELETEGLLSSSSPSPTPASPSPVSPNSSVANQNSKHRTPLIKFLGKRLAKTSPNHTQTLAQPKPIIPKQSPVETGTGIDFATLPGKAWFGRPVLSETEIEAIESGGATLFSPTIAKAPKKK